MNLASVKETLNEKIKQTVAISVVCGCNVNEWIVDQKYWWIILKFIREGGPKTIIGGL